jgi:signal transduction histidine kinase
MSSTAKANTALAAAMIFLLLSSCAAYFAFARLRTSQLWVEHTREVQHALDQFTVNVGRAGRLRGEFVDLGDESVLERQADAMVKVRRALAVIQQLTADNVAQQQSYRKLGELTERRIALMDRAVELRRSGHSSLEDQIALARQITPLVDESDEIIRTMDEREQQLLTERQRREGGSFTVTAAILLTSLFLALVLFLIHHRLLTEQVRERLRAEGAQRTLSARLLTMQDEERRKFARELHDSVGQQLAAMKMAISMLEAKLPGDTLIQDCLTLLDDSITETRTISHLLHPPLLDDAGVNSAFRWFVEGFAKRSGISVDLEIQSASERFDEATELVLFRVLQESLTNVHRHSGAKQADVSLSTSGNSIILKVRDHGRGVPPAVLQRMQDEGTAGGVGLAGMTERIREIGGRLEVHSTADGTEIVVRVPLRPRPELPLRENLAYKKLTIPHA